jgi:hypothetical protein
VTLLETRRRFRVAVTRTIRKEYVLTLTVDDPLHVRRNAKGILDNRSTRPTASSVDVEMEIHHITEEE